jgi:hypothetical protein
LPECFWGGTGIPVVVPPRLPLIHLKAEAETDIALFVSGLRDTDIIHWYVEIEDPTTPDSFAENELFPISDFFGGSKLPQKCWCVCPSNQM